MALSAIAEVVGSVMLELALQIFGYWTGRVVVPGLTLGRIQVEPLMGRRAIRPSAKGAWLGRPTGKAKAKVISAEEGAFAGLFFWAAAVLLAGMVWWAARG